MAQVQQLIDMGFEEADAIRALKQVNSNLEQAIERLLSGGVGEPEPPPPRRPRAPLDQGGYGLSSQPEAAPLAMTPPRLLGPEGLLDAGAPDAAHALPALRTGDEDLDLSTALEMSMREQREGLAPAPEGTRKHGLPCGLLNIGNTCYVNSLLQTLIHIDEFRERMLRYRTPPELAEGGAGAAGGGAAASCSSSGGGEAAPTSEPEAEDGPRVSQEGRRQHGIQLASALRHLFAQSLFTTRSCIDPSRLLRGLVDPRGQKLPIGSQEDVGEFMLKLLEQLDEGLKSGDFVLSAEPRDGPPPAATEDSGQTGAAEPPDGSAAEPPEGCAAEPPAAEPASQAAEEDPVAGAAPAGGQATPAAEGAPEDAGEAAAGPDGRDGAANRAATATDRAADAAEIGKEGDEDGEGKPSLLQTLFFGEQVQVISYQEAAKDLAEEPDPTASGEKRAGGAPARDSELKSPFLHIFLDVKRKDLYSAWEAASRNEVDYTTPSGSSTRAGASTWIRRPPHVLFFQLQRVGFDQEKKVQVKIDDAFEFDTTIHVDRFLYENRAHASEVASRVNDLRRRRDELAQALRGFEDYRGRAGLQVEDVLAWAAECLEENAAAARELTSPEKGREEDASSAPPAAELSEPHRIAALPGAAAPPELERLAPGASQLLRGLRDACQARAQHLGAELGRLAAEISDAYEGLRSQAYRLHAIWVHSGIAGSGHYLAYMKDWQNDRWFRLDDALASEVAWEDVRAAAVGQEGSNTSAYVLVYLRESLAEDQARARDPGAALRAAEAALPTQLLQEIQVDNQALREEQSQHERRMEEQELRRHAEAIFQHYATLVHQWEPLKRTGDNAGSPFDLASRKFLHDSALQCYELFLYRLHGEQEVWTSLLTQSVEGQRKLRHWKEEDEGRILYLLAGTLRSQKCYAQMLRERPSDGTQQPPQCELVPLDTAKLSAQYNVVLIQAHIIDEALQLLKDDRSQLVKCIGTLAFVWARWNLEAEDKFRQNEVLLIVSSLIFNTVNDLEKKRPQMPEASLASFQAAFEYFLLLLHAVEWPKSWKAPVIQRIQGLFPLASPTLGKSGKEAPGSAALQYTENKELVLKHPLTQAHWDNLECQRPEPGQEFFERHRSLYGWVMQNDEAIAREYVLTQVPSLRSEA